MQKKQVLQVTIQRCVDNEGGECFARIPPFPHDQFPPEAVCMFPLGMIPCFLCSGLVAGYGSSRQNRFQRFLPPIRGDISAFTEEILLISYFGAFLPE